MNRTPATFYVENGSIYSGYHGNIIEKPAVLCDKRDDALFGTGPAESLRADYDRITARCRAAGHNDMADDLTLIELDRDKLPIETICYVMRRASEYSCSGFLPKLAALLETGGDPAEWLRSEMARVPLDVYSKTL